MTYRFLSVTPFYLSHAPSTKRVLKPGDLSIFRSPSSPVLPLLEQATKPWPSSNSRLWALPISYGDRLSQDLKRRGQRLPLASSATDRAEVLRGLTRAQIAAMASRGTICLLASWFYGYRACPARRHWKAQRFHGADPRPAAKGEW
jgi:hypothetical protein